MSAAILQDPKKKHDAEDDRESAYHLLNWLALRYTAHDKMNILHQYLTHFDECYKDGSVDAGGDSKRSRIIAPPPITFESSNLNLLLEELVKVMVVRYERPPSRAEYEALEQLEDKIKASEKIIQEADIRIQAANIRVQEANIQIQHADTRLQAADIQLQAADIRLQETINQLQETSVSSEVLTLRLALRDSQVTIRDGQISKRDDQITIRDRQISKRDDEITIRDSQYAFLHTKKMELLSAKGWLVGVLRRHLESDGWPENDAAKANLIGTGPPKKRTWEQGQIDARLPLSKHRRLSVIEWDPDGMESSSDDNGR